MQNHCLPFVVFDNFWQKIKHFCPIYLLKLIVSIGSLGTITISCHRETPQEAEYSPIEEFKPAWEVLTNAINTPDSISIEQVHDTNDLIEYNIGSDSTYDIEKTIKILNGLELAQSQAEDFYSFLEYMAKQDYTMVPKEVIAGKLKLFPVLQKMFILQKENEQLSGLSGVLSCLGTGLFTLAYESNLSATVSTATTTGIDVCLDPAAIAGESAGKMVESLGLDQAKTAALDQYAEQQKLKKENLKTIESLKAAYLEYLNEFTPIYMKYIKEWDRLCLEKDKVYLDIYSNRPIDGYNNVQKILTTYPTNREALLLKSLACINIARGNRYSAIEQANNLAPKANSSNYKFLIEADQTLDYYLQLYPEKSAPALVLKGQIYLTQGQNGKAVSCFDQAAMEYPRQAEELKDLLNSYSLRTYLNATPEGMYLLKLYNSTMEGYGWFSPNFQKALYWESQGQTDQAAKEIYNHFFRRNNQGLYDCLLTDMEFCENNLYKSFKSQFLESSVLNLSLSEDKHLFGKNGIALNLTNNADTPIDNIRLFVCLHLKDMYTDEYIIYPCKSISYLNPTETQTWTTTDYSVEDIVRVRAILMTDDRVCWVDDINYKRTNATKNLYQAIQNNLKPLDIFSDFGLSNKSITNFLINGMTGSIQSNGSGLMNMVKGVFGGQSENNHIHIELPRILCLIDPVFSIDELGHGVTPTHQLLRGSVIALDFEYELKEPYFPLYIYSNFINLKADCTIHDNGSISIKNVSKI